MGSVLPADMLCTPLAALQYSCMRLQATVTGSSQACMCLQVCTHEFDVAGCSCRCAWLQVIWGPLQGLH